MTWRQADDVSSPSPAGSDTTLSPRRDRWILLPLIALLLFSLAWKVKVLYERDGFFIADDLEIVQIHVSETYGWNDYWKWSLRSPFYTHGVQLPATLLAKALKPHDPWDIVIILRFYTILASLFVMLLAYRLAEREEGKWAGVLVLFILTFSWIHNDFSATVLPRTFEALFLLLSLLLVRNSRYTFSGFLFALSLLVRYSSFIFLPGMVFELFRAGKWRAVKMWALSFFLTFAALTSIFDWLYHGSPFFSTVKILSFTLVAGSSSRGYQPFHWYLSHGMEWAAPALLLLILLSLKEWKISLAWIIAPLALLSILPHKEARYLVPFLPIAALYLSTIFVRWWRPLKERKPRLALSMILLLIVFTVYPRITQPPLPCYSEELSLAKSFHEDPSPGIVLIPFGNWVTGGKIYFGKESTIYSYESLDQLVSFLSVIDKESSVVAIIPRLYERERVESVMESRDFHFNRLSSTYAIFIRQ